MKSAAKPRSPATKTGGRLFQEPERPAGVYTAYVDGAARGNPGPASYAVILRAPDGSTAFQIGKYLGRATNNVAEYYALIGALDYAQSQQIAHLAVRSDSELLVRQMQGRYKVKSPDLRPLHERAQKMARALAHFDIEHIPRERNSEADQLANLALDATSTIGGTAREKSVASAAAPATLRTAAAPAAAARDGRSIRARFSAGALHPLEALELSEGDIVEITFKKPAPR
jgi:probable phosphoglycerate mutase